MEETAQEPAPEVTEDPPTPEEERDDAEIRVLLPTRDGTMRASTALALTQLPSLFGRPKPVRFIIVSASNIPRGRNKCREKLQEHLGRKTGHAWVLWVDSDIEIVDIRQVAEAIKHSWDTGVGFTAHYRMASGTSTLLRRTGADQYRNYTVEELAELPPWFPIPLCGFGLLFHRLDLAYTFRADKWGEDVNYWTDHPEEVVAYAKYVQLTHYKEVPI